MREVTADPESVAYCGLYCGACKAFLIEKCPGCHKNEKASWCKIRICCIEKKIPSCAACDEFQNPVDCKKFNNIISRIFGFIFRSDRAACIAQIKSIGLDGHANAMAAQKLHSIKRR
ncbi:MAG TPA: DUF3795 domain-containing protein [Elusimicrobiota bacterium]|nr:DUF3795 domain-containing protein [Elusimicrobiota bacterium]